MGVVEGQGGAHRGFHPKAAQDRLGAVVAGPHGDTLLVQCRTDSLGLMAIDHKGQHASLVIGAAQQPQAPDCLQAGRGIGQ